jgi:hypothetical protein
MSLLKNVSTAVRVYCSFAESEVMATPATAWSDVKALEVVKRAPRGAALAAEIEKLPEADRKKVLRYAGAFEPLSPVGETYEFSDAESAMTFAEQASSAGPVEIFNDHVVNIRDQDYALATQAAATVGGAIVRDVIKDDFEKLDLRLPHDMLTAGLPVELVEQAITQAIEAREKANLSESLIVISTEGPAAAFKGRLESFVRPRPQEKMVLGISESHARMLFKSGIMKGHHDAALGLLAKAIGEAEAGIGSVPADKAIAQGAPPDRGGVAKDQPDVSAGQPATSKDEPKKEPKAPTEVVPDQAKEPEGGEVRLPDGTVVPQDVLKQAMAKLLANLATQLEQGTVGGKPEKPKGDAAAPAAPKDPEAPKDAAPAAAPAGVAAPPSKTDTKAVAEDAPKKSAPAPKSAPATPKGAEPPTPKTGEAPSKEEYSGSKTKKPFPKFSDPDKVKGHKAKKTDESDFALTVKARELGVDYSDIAQAMLDGTIRSLVEDVAAAVKAGALAEISGPARAFISRKIAVLRREGRPEDQAQAIAHDLARKAGYDVPTSRGEDVDALEGTGAEKMKKTETSSASLPMTESDTDISITVANPAKFDTASFHVIDMGEGVKANAGKLIGGDARERIQKLTFSKPAFNEAKAVEWIEKLRIGAQTPKRRPELAEKKEEAGEQEELAQGAHAFEEALKSVSALKSSAFQLVTRELVQIEAICQALDCKKSGRAVTKLRETFNELHDQIKKAYGDFMKAHDAFMSESKAPEAVQADPLTMDTAAAMGVPASISIPGAATPGMTPSVPAPVAESKVAKAVARLSGHGFFDRILDGEPYASVANSIAVATSDIGLTTREIAETHNYLRRAAEKTRARVYGIALSDKDRELLSQVSESGDVTERLYAGTANGQKVSIVESELDHVTAMLRRYGEVEHRLLADEFDTAVGRQPLMV